MDEIRSLLRENGEAVAGVGILICALTAIGMAIWFQLEPWRIARKKLKNLPRTEDDR